MTSDAIFKAFNNFDLDDMPPEAVISRRMLARLKNIDDQTAGGPATPAARSALASSVVAHALVELEIRLIELTERLAARE